MYEREVLKRKAKEETVEIISFWNPKECKPTNIILESHLWNIANEVQVQLYFGSLIDPRNVDDNTLLDFGKQVRLLYVT